MITGLIPHRLFSPKVCPLESIFFPDYGRAFNASKLIFSTGGLLGFDFGQFFTFGTIDFLSS